MRRRRPSRCRRWHADAEQVSAGPARRGWHPVVPWSSQAEPLIEIPTPDAACACEEAAPLVAGGSGLQPLLSRSGRPFLQRGEAPKQR